MATERFECPTCALTSVNAGALATHAVACRKKRKLEQEAIDSAAKEVDFRSQTHDKQGRLLWRTEHNDKCENCDKEGHLLLCSYCNTSWHLGCTPEQLTEAPEGHWMCSLCVEAERGGEDFRHHGLDGEDDFAGAGAFDPDVDADDVDGHADFSNAAYDDAGILPFAPSVWEATTTAALQRAIQEPALPDLTSATVVDDMLNRLKSRFALSLPVMLAFDEVIEFILENPDETYTPARQRSKDLTAELERLSPAVPYQVSSPLVSFIVSALT
jgi:hypothetical protein